MFNISGTNVVSSADLISETFFWLIARKLVVGALEALPVDVEVKEGYRLTLTYVIACVFTN